MSDNGSSSGYTIDEQLLALQSAMSAEDDDQSVDMSAYRSFMSINNAPEVLANNLTVLGNEYLAGSQVVRSRDVDGDEIIRYRIIHLGTDRGDGNEGYFEYRGVKMEQDVAFYVNVDFLSELFFFSAALGQNTNYPDLVRVRAFDGKDWSLSKIVSVLTEHNQFRPVVTPIHQEIVAEQEVRFSNLFTWSDRDGNRVKWYEVRDLTGADASAYLKLDGVNLQGTGWIRLTTQEMNRLTVIAGDETITDRFQIRSSDGRHLSQVKTSVVNTLGRPKIGVETNIVLNELERVSLDNLVYDDSSVPPVTTYEFMELSSDFLSAEVVDGYDVLANNQVHTVSANQLRTIDLRGGYYDDRTHETILVRASNGNFWTPWERIDVVTEPWHIASLDTGEDWTRYLPTPLDGDPLVITYSFMQATPDYYGGAVAGFARLSDEMRESFRVILSQMSETINVQFVEVTHLDNAVIQIGSSDQGAWVPGVAYLPDDTTLNPIGGDIWINNFIDVDIPISWPAIYSDTDPGSLSHAYMRRFVGEAMGLKVPTTGVPLLPQFTDSHKYTAMAHSFITEPQSPKEDRSNNAYARSFQLYDLAALREDYGENPNTRLGNDVYQYEAGNQIVVTTLVDGGGVDTLDLSNQNSQTTIDLRQGGFSSFGRNGFGDSGDRNLAIAYGTEIENAIGSANSDLLSGNELNNTLYGENGDDTLRGLGGDDLLMGGDGSDTYVFDLYGDHDRIDDGDGNSIDTLIINTHSDDLSDFTEHLAFRRSGDNLYIALTLDTNGTSDLIDGTVRIHEADSRAGVEILRVLDNDGNSLFGDIDLTSAYDAADTDYRHMTITGATSTYGSIVAQA